MGLPATVAAHGGGVCGRRHWASWGYWDKDQEPQVYNQLRFSGEDNRSIHVEVVLTKAQCKPFRLELLKAMGFVLTETYVNDNSRNTLFIFTRVQKRLSVVEGAKEIGWSGTVLTPDLEGTLPVLNINPGSKGAVQNPFGGAVTNKITKTKELLALEEAVLNDKILQEYVKSILEFRDAVMNHEGNLYANYYGGRSGYVKVNTGDKDTVYLSIIRHNGYEPISIPKEITNEFVLNNIFNIVNNIKTPGSIQIATTCILFSGQTGLSKKQQIYYTRVLSDFVDKTLKSSVDTRSTNAVHCFEKELSAVSSNCQKALSRLESLIQMVTANKTATFLEAMAESAKVQVHKNAVHISPDTLTTVEDVAF